MGIDTLSIAKDLRAAALPQDQAEAIAAVIGRAMSEGAATKGDLDRLGERVDARFVDARFAQVDARFDQIEARLEEADVKVDARFAQVATDLRLIEERITARIESAKTQLLT